MSLDNTTRRRLLRSIGVTGLAIGTVGVASAEGSEVKETDASPEDGEVSPDGWEYKCGDIRCTGGGLVEFRRYCASGDCSGWESTGNCCPM